jgi:hypothetical protein
MKSQRILSPKTAASLATAVGAASTKAAIVTWSITPSGSMQAINGEKDLRLSTHSTIRVTHSFDPGFTTTTGGYYTGPSNSNFISGTVYTVSQNRHLAVRGVGEISFLNARGKGADFAVNRSDAFSSGNLTISSYSSSFYSSRGAEGGLNLIPVQFKDDGGNVLLGVAEVDFEISSNPGYINLVNFWYSDDAGVAGLRWDSGAQRLFEVGPTAVPEPRGAAAVLLAGLAAVAQSRRRKPQARGLGALAAGMGGLVARAGREDS